MNPFILYYLSLVNQNEFTNHCYEKLYICVLIKIYEEYVLFLLEINKNNNAL
jgi:hypothetical protein